MGAKIIDGAQIAAELRAAIAQKVKKLKEKGTTPALAVILAGNDPASQSYVKGKTTALHEAGMEEKTIPLPDTAGQGKLI